MYQSERIDQLTKVLRPVKIIDSLIIKEYEHRQFLKKNICEDKDLKLVYRGSLHGFGSKDYHNKCDGK